MSYANGTTHFNLPITSGSDKRDWADTNQAFQDIDAAIYQAGEDASTAGSGVTALDTQINGVGGIDSRLTQAESDIDNVEGAVSTLQGTVSGHTTAIADVRRDLQDNIEAFNEPTATSTHAYAIGDYFYYNDILYKATAAIAIGDTIVPNTNCTATDVMSEVSLNKSAANISLAPITGMTADDVQEGIAELKSDLDKGSISITADGVKTYATLFSELANLIDFTKMRDKSVLVMIASAGVTHYGCQQYGDHFAQFGTIRVPGTGSMSVQGINLNKTDSTHIFFTRATIAGAGNTIDNRLSEVADSGLILKVVY